jgi:tRNA dimethylallyltransferase
MAKVVVLAGPTAAGKTEAAIAVARRYEAVIVSADAMQVYRGMDIGTGKATPEERAAAPHFGLDLVDPDQPFDAASFVALADAVCAAHPRVVVAGGTTLYLQALIRGLVPTPPVDLALRAELDALADPHAALAEVDPALARRLHPNDRVRIVRGLEVYRASGVRLSELHDAHARAPDRLEVVGRWLDRDDLDVRIARRLQRMWDGGYVDEVRHLLDRGYDRSLKPLGSLGYRHLCDHVLDGLPPHEAHQRTLRDTLGFARKQRTWMRSLGFPKVSDDGVAGALAAAAEAWGN